MRLSFRKILLLQVAVILFVFIILLVLYFKTFSREASWHCSKYNQTKTTVDVTNVKVMCLVMVSYKSWNSKARAVRDTWAKKCDKVRYIYSIHKDKPPLPFPAIGIESTDHRDYLTPKVMEAFALAYTNFSTEIDWFLKADDDTYIVMENLKLLLSQYNPSEPRYLGRLFPNQIYHGYNSGGAGYVLSKEAAKVIALDKKRIIYRCSWRFGRIEDLDLGRCLARHGIYPEKTTDKECRLKFHSDDIIFSMTQPKALYSYYKPGFKEPLGYAMGHRILSPWTISFHHLRPQDFYNYEYFIYQFMKASEI